MAWFSDALGDQSQAERVGEQDRRADDSRGPRVLGHARDEGLVELELVDRQLAQVGQRRVARTEVVDDHADAVGAQLDQDLAGPLAVRHQEVLGDLQLEHPRGQAALGEQQLDPGRQVDVDQRGGGEVDRDRQRAAGVLPADHLVEGLLEHGRGEVAHQPGVLDERQELVRGKQTAGRVVPAHQRLDAGDEQGLRVDLGLVVHRQGTGVDDAAQLLEGAQPVLATEHVVLDAVDGLADPVRLRVVHRDVGLAQQRRQLGARAVGHRDAEAGLDPYGDAVDDERRRDRGADPVGQLDGRCLVEIVEQQGELVTGRGVRAGPRSCAGSR